MLIDCDFCNAIIDMEEIGSFIQNNPNDIMDELQYTFCKCPKCFSAILTEQVREYESANFYWGNPKKIYPNNVFHINPIIPLQLRNSLNEAINCHKSKANTATVIMCRRTLEGFCSLKGIQENNLDKSIKKLKEDSVINEQLFEWANHLRLVGNKAAHNIESEFSNLDSKDILDFTIAILDFTYSFKDKFDKFKARQNS